MTYLIAVILAAAVLAVVALLIACAIAISGNQDAVDDLSSNGGQTNE